MESTGGGSIRASKVSVKSQTGRSAAPGKGTSKLRNAGVPVEEAGPAQNESSIPRKRAGFFMQTVLLSDKIWKSIGRRGRKALFVVLIQLKQVALPITFVGFMPILIIFGVQIWGLTDIFPYLTAYGQINKTGPARDIFDTSERSAYGNVIRSSPANFTGATRKYNYGSMSIFQQFELSPEVRRRQARLRRKKKWKGSALQDDEDNNSNKNDFADRKNVRLHIAPDTPFTRAFADEIAGQWGSLSDMVAEENRANISFAFFKSPKALEEQWKAYKPKPTTQNSECYYSKNSIIFALILPEAWQADVQVLEYTIRTDPGTCLQSSRIEVPPSLKKKYESVSTCRKEYDSVDQFSRARYNIKCPVEEYRSSRFLAVQSAIEHAALSKRLRATEPDTTLSLKVTMGDVPKDLIRKEEAAATLFRIILVFFTAFPLSGTAHTLLISIVTEKSEGVKDGLKLVGISDGAYWMSWLVSHAVVAILHSTLFASIISSVFMPRIATFGVLFLLFLGFSFSLMTFSFALASLFHTPKTAGLVGVWIVRITMLLFLVPSFLEDYADAFTPLKLISPYAFTTGLDQALKYWGISWSRVKFDYPTGRQVATSLIFLHADLLVYGFIGFYLDNVLPNTFGVRRHPLFLFLPSYWTAGNESWQDDGPIPEAEQVTESEEVSQDLKGSEAIKIRHITKTFTAFPSGAKVRALKGISLDIYPGQITAILGRNGAGKTTLISILTGLIPPTSGAASVYGYDTRRPYDQSHIRQIVGVCYQTNLYFEALTVQEHLIFYEKLRGMSSKELRADIDRILDELNINDVRFFCTKEISGGQQRKLSVGIALIGDPPVVLFDEPSAGLDPASRRDLWALIQRKKEGRFDVSSTKLCLGHSSHHSFHFIDEADVLADRKAIIQDGVIRCVESSLYLKNKFGGGYLLTIELGGRQPDGRISDEIVAKHIPQAVSGRKIIAGEAKYTLPHTETSKFPSIFADLEEQMKSGKSIKSFGVSMTTLEEVFLRVSAESGSAMSTTNEEGRAAEINLLAEIQRSSGGASCLTIIFSLCLVRFRRLYRSFGYLFLLFLLPVALTVGGLLVLFAFGEDLGVKVNFDDPRYFYPDFRLAVFQNDSELATYLVGRGLDVIKTYTGEESDLLKHGHQKNPISAGLAWSGPLKRNFDNQASVEMRVNGTFVHAPPIILNLLFQYIGSVLSPEKPVTKMTIQPFVDTRKAASVIVTNGVIAIILMAGAMVFSATALIAEVCHDKEILVRNHLRLNGVNFLSYFASTFIVFFPINLLLVMAQVALSAAFQIDAFFNGYAITIIIVWLTLWVIAFTLFAMIFTYAFNTSTGAELVYVPLAVTGIHFLVVMVLVDFFAQASREIYVNNNKMDQEKDPRNLYGKALAVNISFAALIPFYFPGAVLYYIFRRHLDSIGFFASKMAGKDPSFEIYFETDELLHLLIVVCVQIPIFMGMLVILEILVGGQKCEMMCRKRSVSDSDMRVKKSRDVLQEEARVAAYFAGTIPASSCVIAAKDLQKSYGTNPILRGLSFMIGRGEVFGLLGHNGAGKTTTIKVLTAEEPLDSGEVSVDGVNLFSNTSGAFQRMGFCPQHDALWENITLKEHLDLYTTIRGLSSQTQRAVIQKFLEGLSIQEHANKYTQKLSGGTKRKLSYAVAMAGAPNIVIMDEPSTGMDPQSKRFLWNTILGSFKESRGALLTTHSMEEADILSTRIAIMVKGQIVCIGTPQHLKSEYGSGYTLEVKVREKPKEQRPTVMDDSESAKLRKKQSQSEEKRQSTVSGQGKNAEVEDRRQSIVSNQGRESETEEKRQSTASGQGRTSEVEEKRQSVGSGQGRKSEAEHKRQSVGSGQGRKSEAEERRKYTKSLDGNLTESAKSLAGKSMDEPQRDVPAEFQFIVDNFTSARLLEVFQNRAVFNVPIESIEQAFSTLEKLKATTELQEYSLSQTTLEQVFLSFSKPAQEDEAYYSAFI